MRVIAIVTGLAVAVGLLAGCGAGFHMRPDAPYRALRKAKTPVAPPPGLIYTHYKAPLSAATGEVGSRTGESTSHQIGLPPLPFPGLTTGLSLFSWGDASRESAVREGGISQVTQVDYDFTVVLMIYRRFRTEVHGN